MNIINSIDTSIFNFINTGLSNVVLDYLMPIFHNPVNPITFIFLLLLFFISFKKSTRKKLLNYSLPNKSKINGTLIISCLLISVLITDQIGGFIKDFKIRERPWVQKTINDMNCLVCKTNEKKIYQSGGSKKSMPSNHSANAISIAFITSLFFPKFKILTYLFALIIMFSRVYIGVHYPADIIIGGTIGLLCSILVGKLVILYLKKP